MGMSVVKAFSLLVASGNGQTCNSFRNSLHRNLIIKDQITGVCKTELFKSTDRDSAQDRSRVGREIYNKTHEYISGIDPYFYGPDRPTPPVSQHNPAN